MPSEEAPSEVTASYGVTLTLQRGQTFRIAAPAWLSPPRRTVHTAGAGPRRGGGASVPSGWYVQGGAAGTFGYVLDRKPAGRTAGWAAGR